MTYFDYSPSRTGQWRRTLAVVPLLFISGLSHAQVVIRTDVGSQSAVCNRGGTIYVAPGSDDCGGGLDLALPTTLRIGEVATGTNFAGNGAATFNAASSFNAPVQITNNLTVSGVTQFQNSVLATQGLTVNGTTAVGVLNAATSARVGGPLTVTGAATIGGLITSNSVIVNTSLAVSQGATVFFGFNRLAGVATPVDASDAATRAYVDASVAQVVGTGAAQGARIDTLETATAAQGTQIVALQSTTAAQGARLTTVEAINATQDGQIGTLQTTTAAQGVRLTAAETVNATQGTQIGALQTATAALDQLTGAQGVRITNAEGVNAAQSTAIGALQSLGSQQGSQIMALQAGQAQLFDLAELNRRDIGKANEGVAMALAMESPALPAGASFALSGGIGYFGKRSAGTAAMTARVGRNSSVSAGVGVGFNTGEVGARGGFQVAW